MNLFDTHSTRSGLAKVNVTPLLYLQLMDKLESGRKVNYTQAQLELAFSKHLTTTKGPWTQTQARDMEGLSKLATNYLVKQQETFEKERAKLSGKPVTVRRQKEMALLKKLGLAKTDDKNLPKDVRGTKTDLERNIDTLDNVDKAIDVVHAISLMGEPASVIAVGLIVMAGQTQFKGAICKMFLDLYENKATSESTKDLILNALGKCMGPKERLENDPQIDTILSNEKSLEKAHRIATEIKAKSHEKDIVDKKLQFCKNHDDIIEKHQFVRAPVKRNLPKELDLNAAFDMSQGPKYIEEKQKSS